LQKKTMKQSVMSMIQKNVKENLILLGLFFVCLPVGAFKIWKSDTNILAKLGYTLFGLPIFLVSYSFLVLTLFAAFLPPLDLNVGDRKDRTIVNSEGNYSATFLKTARETGNVYELIQVEVEPDGGNDPHYHKEFAEHFEVLQGTLTVYVKGVPHHLNVGDTMSAPKHTMHHFRNETKSLVVMNVKTTPAGGLEKTLRVAYGLINTKQLKNNFTENPWHMCLLLGYSGSYLEGMPSFIQEPLVTSLARIAQWKGEDKDLEVFYR
jgi:mannose-6-phosphate isomerase-like protein (cupin superfamily)